VLLDAAEPGQLPTQHPEIEQAVLDLLNEKEESPRIENLAA
jgi:DNA topoisomerase-1